MKTLSHQPEMKSPLTNIVICSKGICYLVYLTRQFLVLI